MSAPEPELEHLPGLDPAPEPEWTPEAHAGAQITVVGRPKPWRRSGYNPKTKTIYTTRKDLAERKIVTDAWLDAGAPNFRDAWLRLRCEFIFDRPKSHYRTGANSHLLRPDADPFPGQSYGDVDNLLKLVADALNDVAYHDDSRIVGYFDDGGFGKRWARKGESACTVIELRLAS